MTKLNHDRPDLRAKDNIRREISKAASFAQAQPPDASWPSFMRPVIDTPDALAALFALIESMSDWFDQDNNALTLADPPAAVVNALNRFAGLRLLASHSGGFRGADWLNEPVTTRSATDFRPGLSLILKALP